MITRTGTNALHGDAFIFLEDGSLNARNPFETERAEPDLHRYRIGTALGGPVLKDRTFYYAAFEQEHSRALDGSFINPGVTAEIQPHPGCWSLSFLPTRSVSDDPFPTAGAETEASVRFNHQLTPRNALMSRYTFTNNREAGDAFNTSGLTDPSEPIEEREI